MKLNMVDKNDWLSVAKDGEPSSGLYPALWRNNGNLVVELCDYSPEQGWMRYVEDIEQVPCTVVAYVPVNLDILSLKDVRSHFKAELAEK